MITDHQLYQNLVAAKESIEPHASSDSPPADVQKFIGQVEYLIWALDNSDPDLVSAQELDQAAAISQNVRNQAAQLSNNAKGHSRNGLTELAQLLQRFPVPRRQVLPKAESHRIIKELEAEANTVRTAIRDKFEDFQKRQEELDGRIKAAKNSQEKIGQEFERVRTATSETATEVTRDLETRIATTLQSEKDRLSGAIDEFQRESSSAREELSTLIEREKSELTALRKELSQSNKEQLAATKDEAEEYIAKIKDLYGLAGSESNSGELRTSADRERTSYVWLASLSGILFVAGSVFVATVIAPIITTDISLEAAISRIAVSAAIFLPAAYLARLAGKHRKAEIAYRSLGLRVAAFDPYILNLPEAERNEMKRQMADVFFTSQLHDDLKSDSNRNRSGVVGSMTDELLSAFERMSDFFKGR